MVKCKGKMTAGKRRVLISHLVAEESNNVVRNNEISATCSTRITCLVNYAKYEANDLTKSQDVITKIASQIIMSTMKKPLNVCLLLLS